MRAATRACRGTGDLDASLAQFALCSDDRAVTLFWGTNRLKVSATPLMGKALERLDSRARPASDNNGLQPAATDYFGPPAPKRGDARVAWKHGRRLGKCQESLRS